MLYGLTDTLPSSYNSVRQLKDQDSGFQSHRVLRGGAGSKLYSLPIRRKALDKLHLKHRNLGKNSVHDAPISRSIMGCGIKPHIERNL